jgi:peptidoglycan/LPS O-acetylase OafA/YrhL
MVADATRRERSDVPTVPLERPPDTARPGNAPAVEDAPITQRHAPRWGSLDVLRGVALYMMVIHHFAKWTGGRVEERFIGFDGLLVTDLAAPIFAVGVGAAAFLVGRRIADWRNGGRRRARTALWRWTQVLLAGLAIDIGVGGGVDGGGVLPSLAVLGVIVTALAAAGVARAWMWWIAAGVCALLVGPAVELEAAGFMARLLNGSFSIAVYGVFAAGGAAVAAHASSTTGGEERLPLLRAALGVAAVGALGAWLLPAQLAPNGLWPPERHPGYLDFTMWGLVASFVMWAAVRAFLASDSRLGAAAARAGRRTLVLFMGHYVVKLVLQHSGYLEELDTWRWGLVAWAAAIAVCVVASLPSARDRTPERTEAHAG